MSWNEREHPRDGEGRWAEKASARLGGVSPRRQTVQRYAWEQASSGNLAYTDLNAGLRGRGQLGPEAEELRDALDREFDQTPPLERAVKVHRMVSDDRNLYYLLMGIAKGDNRRIFHDRGYASTSRSKDIAEDFAGQFTVELEITVPKGGKVLDVDMELGDSLEYPQQEMLLPRDTRLKLGDPVPVGPGRVRIPAKVVV